MQRVIHQQTLKNPWCWQYNLVLDCIITTPDFLRFYRLMQDCDIFSVSAMKITRSLLYISCHSLTTSLTITCQTWLMHYALACSICQYQRLVRSGIHDDVIKWKQFPRHWRFVRGIHVVCFIEKSNMQVIKKIFICLIYKLRIILGTSPTVQLFFYTSIYRCMRHHSSTYKIISNEFYSFF